MAAESSLHRAGLPPALATALLGAGASSCSREHPGHTPAPALDETKSTRFEQAQAICRRLNPDSRGRIHVH